MDCEVEKKTSLLLGEIQHSKLSVDEKLDLENLLSQAAHNTNGSEDKIQGIAMTLFGLVQIMVSRRLDGNEGKLAGLYKVLVECKWAIVTLGGLICGLLAYRPEVSAVIKELVK